MNKNKKDSEKKYKHYYVIGFIVFFTSWIPSLILVDGLSLSGSISLCVMAFQMMIGGIFILIAARLEKIVKNNPNVTVTLPKNIFRIFTIPQFLSLCVILMIFGVIISEALGIKWLFVVFIIAVYAFVIAAIVVSVVQHLKKKKSNLKVGNEKEGCKSDSILFCASCRKKLLGNQLNLIGESPYCDSCYSVQMDLLEKEKIKQQKELLHTQCDLCNRDFPKSSFHIVDDKFICDECFQKEFVVNNLFSEEK